MEAGVLLAYVGREGYGWVLTWWGEGGRRAHVKAGCAKFGDRCSPVRAVRREALSRVGTDRETGQGESQLDKWVEN